MVKGVFQFHFYSPKKSRKVSQSSELLDKDRVCFGSLKAI